jgi:hypothetical protein
MLKLILTAGLSAFYCLTFAQAAVNPLADITNVIQAEEYIAKNQSASPKLFSISSDKDTSEILLPLYEQKMGFTFSISTNVYKILSIDSTLSFRASYIYLDGQKLSKEQADDLRNKIIAEYKAGTSFVDLVRKYNMDGNTTGDMGWFSEGVTVQPFEDAVRAHKKNDIFTVDTPERKWYHVVLKTFDDTFIKKETLITTTGNK